MFLAGLMIGSIVGGVFAIILHCLEIISKKQNKIQNSKQKNKNINIYLKYRKEIWR